LTEQNEQNNSESHKHSWLVGKQILTSQQITSILL